MSGFSLCSDIGEFAGRETVDVLANMKTLALNSPRGRERDNSLASIVSV